MSGLTALEKAALDLDEVLREAQAAFALRFPCDASVPLPDGSGFLWWEQIENERLFVVRKSEYPPTVLANCDLATQVQAAHALERLRFACQEASNAKHAEMRNAADVARLVARDVAGTGKP